MKLVTAVVPMTSNGPAPLPARRTSQLVAPGEAFQVNELFQPPATAATPLGGGLRQRPVSSQWVPPAHARKQAPQLASLLTSVSQPSALSRLQFPNLATQVMTSHAPARHPALAPGSVHINPSGAIGFEHKPLAGLHVPAT